jgi:lysozyme family protein
MKSDQFLACLAVTLRHETGYPQIPGGPVQRLGHGPAGPVTPPSKPDDLFFSDDPRDHGGRTGGGITQSEYDAWRRVRGLALRDVWRIEDGELLTLYQQQYWDAVNADDLPPGLNLAVFDMSVLAGVGTAIKALQTALRVPVDGHFGAVTRAAIPRDTDAIQAAIHVLCAARRAHLRACSTFRDHGRSWLARVAAVEATACWQVVRTTVTGLADLTPPPLPVLEPISRGGKAVLPPEPTTAAASTTIWAALATIGAAVSGVIILAAQAVLATLEAGHGPEPTRILALLAANPLTYPAVGGAVSAVLLQSYVIAERLRRMIRS